MFAVIFGALFVLFLFTAVYTLYCGLRSRHFEGRTDGRIIDIQHFGSHREKSRNHNYRPVFRYEVDGTEYKRPFDVTSKNPDRYTVGEVVPLAYDLSHPERFAPVGDTSMALSSIPFFVGAALCIALFFISIS